MTLTLLFDHFDRLITRAEDIPRLNELILQLAVQGRLVAQDPANEPASALLARIKAEKARLVKEKKIRRPKKLPPISDEEIPFDLPEGWVWARMNDIAVKLGSGSTPRGGRKVYQKSGIKFIRSQNVWSDGLKLDGVAHISDEINRRMSNSVVLPKDVLLNITGASIGRSAVVPDDFDTANVNQHVAIIRLVDLEIRHFVHICLISQYIQNLVMNVQVGISREGLSMGRLAKFALPLPPLAEQRRIVERVETLLDQTRALESELAAAEAERAALTRASLHYLTAAPTPAALSEQWQELAPTFDALLADPAAVDKLKQAILQLAVQGRLVPQSPADEPASILLERIKAEKARLVEEGKIRRSKKLPPVSADEKPFDVPAAWEWVRLDHICFQITDGTHHTPTYVNEGVPFLSVKNISQGFIDFSDTRFITREEHEKLVRRCKPEYGDVLLTKIGTTGIAKVIDTTKEFSIFVSVALLKFDQNKLYPIFLEYLLNSPLVKQQSNQFTMGVGNKNLVLKYIKDFVVPLPPLAEQQRIVERVEQLLALCDDLQAQLEAGETARQRLLASLLHNAANGPFPGRAPDPNKIKKNP